MTSGIRLLKRETIRQINISYIYHVVFYDTPVSGSDACIPKKEVLTLVIFENMTPYLNHLVK